MSCVTRNTRGKQSAPWPPGPSQYSGSVERRLEPFCPEKAGRGWAGSRAYVEGESIVERIRTTSARCVAEMCWVMWTMESMATSGLACTKLRICLRT